CSPSLRILPPQGGKGNQNRPWPRAPLSSCSRKKGEAQLVPQSLKTVAVIGNGIIGHGIAQIFAAAGKDVVMIGRSEPSLAKAKEKIAASLGDFAAHELVERGAIPAILARIRTSTKLEDAAPAELVIEAVTEDLPLKR